MAKQILSLLLAGAAFQLIAAHKNYESLVRASIEEALAEHGAQKEVEGRGRELQFTSGEDSK